MISIITPVYNGEQFIESCIKSVIGQNCSDVEHIIMDGGSTDGTVEIVKQYAAQYPHIRWFSERDQGQSDAMNKGVSVGQGTILSFLNVDDFYEPNVLNRILELFKTLPEPSLVVGNCNIWGNEGKILEVNQPCKLKLSELLMGPHVNQYPLNPSAYFYHKSLHQAIGLYEVDEHYAMDIDFLFRAVQVATVEYKDEIWGNYRKIEGTKTANDIEAGRNLQRIDILIKKYRKNLPLFQQWYIATNYQLGKFEIWRRTKYFLIHPMALFPSFKKRLFQWFNFV